MPSYGHNYLHRLACFSNQNDFIVNIRSPLLNILCNPMQCHYLPIIPNMFRNRRRKPTQNSFFYLKDCNSWYKLWTHRWAQTTNPLISEANIFASGLAVPLTFKNVNGLVIEANFFSESANALEKIAATVVSIKHSQNLPHLAVFAWQRNMYFKYTM